MYWGEEYVASTAEQRKIFNINAATAIACFSMALYGILYMVTGNPALIKGSIGYLPFYGIFPLIPWLNRKGKIAFATWLFCLLLPAVIFSVMTAAQGTYLHLHYYFLLFGIIPIMFFPFDKWRAILFLFLLNTTAFILSSYVGITPNPKVLELAPWVVTAFRAGFSFTSVATILFIVWLSEYYTGSSESHKEAILRKYRSLVQNIPEVIWSADDKGNTTYISPNVTAMYGYTPEELYAEGEKLYFGRIHPDDIDGVSNAYMDLHGVGQRYSVEFRIRKKNGDWIWLHDRAVATYKENGLLMADGIISEITERKQTEEKLRLSEERHRLLADNSSDVIWTMGLDGRFTYVSPSVEKLRGYTQAEVIQQSMEEALTPRSLAVAAEGIKNVVASVQSGMPAETFRGHIEQPCKDGLTIWTEMTVSAICRSDGSFVELLGVARDITDRLRYEKEIEQARIAAETANKAKSEFLANMSHEIRTPMNGIIGMSQLLEFTELTDEQREYLDIIVTSARSLLSQINDILDLSKIESGKIELEYLDFSLRNCISDVTKMQISLIHNKGLGIQTDIPDSVPDRLNGDPLRLKQILINLLGNAVKFTEKGGIRITVAVREHRGDRVLLNIGVIDSGIGISPKNLEKIFEPFVQADTSTTRNYGGTGLGLTICTRLAELMGGKIRAESTKGVGTSFFVEIPFIVRKSDVERQTTGKIEKISSLSNGLPLRILVVDDLNVNRIIATRILQKFGHTVIDVEDGRQAVQKWEQEDFDIILMDIQMPVMSGIEATEAIRDKENQTGGHVPIIALTARAMREEQEEICSRGFDGYLTKPFDINNLFSEIQRCMLDSRHPDDLKIEPLPSPQVSELLETVKEQLSAILGEIEFLLETHNMAVIDKISELEKAVPLTVAIDSFRQQVKQYHFDRALALLPEIYHEFDIMPCKGSFIGHGQKILIVDDIPENLTTLYHALRDDYDVYGATSGKDAIMMAQSRRPDLILLDIMMPEMDGYEVCTALHGDSETRDIPVIFITARIEAESETRAFSSGGVDFIHKPFNVLVVRARVALHLELMQRRHHLEELVFDRTRELAEARDIAEF